MVKTIYSVFKEGDHEGRPYTMFIGYLNTYRLYF